MRLAAEGGTRVSESSLLQSDGGVVFKALVDETGNRAPSTAAAESFASAAARGRAPAEARSMLAAQADLDRGSGSSECGSLRRR